MSFLDQVSSSLENFREEFERAADVIEQGIIRTFLNQVGKPDDFTRDETLWYINQDGVLWNLVSAFVKELQTRFQTEFNGQVSERNQVKQITISTDVTRDDEYVVRLKCVGSVVAVPDFVKERARKLK